MARALRRRARFPRHPLVETEKSFQATIVSYAQLHGWLSYHSFDSRKSVAGFPDLVLCKPGRLVFAELKREDGRLSPSQSHWLTVLSHSVAGIETYTWRPSDWRDIERILR